MSTWVRGPLGLAVAIAIALGVGSARAQDDLAKVSALIRDLKSPDFDTAHGAVEELAKYPQHRTQIIAGLIEAVTTRDWNRCGGDMRDAIARRLGELKAKEAVGPLLEVVRSGKSTEHECAE